MRIRWWRKEVSNEVARWIKRGAVSYVRLLLNLFALASFILPWAMTATAVAARASVEVKAFGEYGAAGQGIAVGVLSPIAGVSVQLFGRANNWKRVIVPSGRKAVHSPLLLVKDPGAVSRPGCLWNGTYSPL